MVVVGKEDVEEGCRLEGVVELLLFEVRELYGKNKRMNE